MPGWNCLKCQKLNSARIRFADEGECLTRLSRVKAVSEGKFGYWHLQGSLAYRQQHGRKDLVENRYGTSSISVRGGMRNANSASGNGDSDQVIVPMISLIIKGKKKGPVDTTTAGSGRERPFIRKGYRGQTSFLYGDEGKEPNKRTADKPYSNGNPPEARACVYNEVAGRGGAIVEALCLKPERRNLKFRNFRGGAGKRIGLIRPDGTSGLNSGKSNHCVCLLLDRR